MPFDAREDREYSDKVDTVLEEDQRHLRQDEHDRTEDNKTTIMGVKSKEEDEGGKCHICENYFTLLEKIDGQLVCVECRENSTEA